MGHDPAELRARSDAVQCPGCHRSVGVARPIDVAYEIVRDHTNDGREQITITLGRVIVHRCLLCRDGEWR